MEDEYREAHVISVKLLLNSRSKQLVGRRSSIRPDTPQTHSFTTLPINNMPNNNPQTDSPRLGISSQRCAIDSQQLIPLCNPRPLRRAPLNHEAHHQPPLPAPHHPQPHRQHLALLLRLKCRGSARRQRAREGVVQGAEKLLQFGVDGCSGLC